MLTERCRVLLRVATGTTRTSNDAVKCRCDSNAEIKPSIRKNVHSQKRHEPPRADSVRPVSADAWGWRSPNPPGINRRLLVRDCQIPECIGRMARPIVFWAQTDTALLVLALVIVAQRIASSFSRRVIKPASRKNAPCRFYAHHRGTGSGILDRSAASDRRRQYPPCISSIRPGSVSVGP